MTDPTPPPIALNGLRSTRFGGMDLPPPDTCWRDRHGYRERPPSAHPSGLCAECHTQLLDEDPDR